MEQTKSENKIFFSRGGHFEDNAISVGAAVIVIENILGTTYRI